MKIEHLNYFIEISKTKSISVAAQNLHLTQQCLSRSIQSLENELSVSLLQRTNKGVVLTEDGKRTLTYATQIVNLAQDMQKELSHNKQQDKNTVVAVINIMYIVTFDLDKLTLAIHNFSKEYPNVKFHIHPSNISSILSSLLAEEIDIGLLTVAENYHLSNVIETHHLAELEITPIFQENLLAAVSKHSTLASHSSISTSTLLKQPLIFFNPNTDSSLDKNWLYYFLQQFGTPDFSFVTSSIEIYLNAIADDAGVGFISRSSLKWMAKEQTDMIKLIPVRPPLKLSSNYVLKRGKPISPVIQDFLAYLANPSSPF